MESGQPPLRRVLTLWPLIFYGLGVIIGAGIYVALGTVIGRAGTLSPISFLLAGLVAGMTGLCYAELAGRFPEASGAAAYVRHGFNSLRLSQLTGVIVTFIAIVSGASIAHGAAAYFAAVLPVTTTALLSLIILSATGIAIAGIRESVVLAALLGVIEIVVLIAVVIAALMAAPEIRLDMKPAFELHVWPEVISGAFIAFFAFVGFESLANLGEEVRDPGRTLPHGILGAVAISIILYFIVATAVVMADLGEDYTLVGLFSGRSASGFAIIGGFTIANGVLVQIVMLSRLFYGMASKGQLPEVFAQVSQKTRTPVIASICAGGLVLLSALMLPFERLLVTANALTLVLFAIVNLALWRVKLQKNVTGTRHFSVPEFLPLLAAAMCAVLLMAEFFK